MARTRLSWPSLCGAALLVAAVAFGVYRATLLPGFDFGDTAAFQDAGGSIEASPRQAYPLYFGFGNVVVSLAGGEPAYGMNLASAIAGAAACGLIVVLVAMVSGSIAAGVFAGVLWAGSYTFWSQSIIAEVYSLHILVLAASLIALVSWSWHPISLARLAAFFAVYALGFGNHLMMILLAPAAVVFIGLIAPGGFRHLVRPRVIAVAMAAAFAGSLQYVWNFSYMWALPYPPRSLVEALHIFWFDVTKSDWRESLVLGVDEAGLRRRVPMYLFDLRQQVGNAGIMLAIVGVGAGALAQWRTLLAGVVAYGVALAFAATYNVGDAHVFFLQSHLFVVVAAGCGIAAILHVLSARGLGSWRSAAAALLLLAWPAWRVVDTYPAVDRSDDHRPLERMRQLAGDLSPERAVFVAQLNWQLQNGLDYYAHHLRPDLLVLRPGSRMLTLPFLIEENRRHGRDVVLTAGSRQLIQNAYGKLFPIEMDQTAAPTLAHRIAPLRAGTPYVLAVLQPYSELPLGAQELQAAYFRLTGDSRARLRVDNVYMVVAGRVGAPPEFEQSGRYPFRAATRIGSLRVDVRMESWLPADTMRRAGFGHVIVERRHALTLERGVSLVALDADGRPLLKTYASSLFAPQPRYRIRAIKGA